jgi:hypothetical protein
MHIAINMVTYRGRPPYVGIRLEDDSIGDGMGFTDSEEGFEDLCHLWVKRACRHAEWEGELI